MLTGMDRNVSVTPWGKVCGQWGKLCIYKLIFPIFPGVSHNPKVYKLMKKWKFFFCFRELCIRQNRVFYPPKRDKKLPVSLR
jgi:hypothetical protein